MKFKFKKDASASSSETYYDLFDGGYIDPKELLEDKAQALAVCEAVDLIQSFLEQMREEKILEEY